VINLVSVWGLSGLSSPTLTGIDKKSREEGRTGGGGWRRGDGGRAAVVVPPAGQWRKAIGQGMAGSHGDVPTKHWGWDGGGGSWWRGGTEDEVGGRGGVFCGNAILPWMTGVEKDRRQKETGGTRKDKGRFDLHPGL